jgi:integrase
MSTIPPRARLTKRAIEALPTPTAEQGDIVVWDTDLAGFGLRMLPSGTRTYVLRRRTRAGRSIRMKIARVGEISCEQARDQAKQLIAQIVTGGDPAADRRRARLAERERSLAPTVSDLAEAWFQDRRPHWRPASEVELGRQIDRHIRPQLGRMKAADVRPRHVRALHAEITRSAPIVANRITSTIRSMYSWALKRDDWASVTANPVVDVTQNDEPRRERYPRNGELQRLVTAMHERQGLAGKFYLFLLLTGARRGEAETMRWTDVDLAAGVWTKPASRTKQRRSHRLPLRPEAVALLREVQVAEPFMPFARLDEWRLRVAWAEILQAANITDLRVHDLRHWHALLLASMSPSLQLIGALLWHFSPSTTQRYAHLLDETLRQAADRVGAVVRLPVKEG